MDKFKVAVVVLVMFSISVTAATEPSDCVSEMIGRSGFTECVHGFTNFLTNSGDLSSPGADNTLIVKTVFCSDEGKAALRCMVPYVQECPGLIQETDGPNLTALLSPGVLEHTCSLLTGPCSGIQKNFTLNNDWVTSSDKNPFVKLVRESAMICGMKDSLENCRQADENPRLMLKLSAEMAMKGDPAFRYDEYIGLKCDNMPKDFGRGCLVNALQSKECYPNSLDEYTFEQQQNKNNCSLYDMVCECLTRIYLGNCSSHVQFFSSNMNVINNKVPATCRVCTSDTGTSDSSIVNIAALTFLVIGLLHVIIA